MPLLSLPQPPCQEVISGGRDGGYRHIEANALALLAEIHWLCHRPEPARATAKEALATLAEFGITHDTTRLREVISQCALHRFIRIMAE